MKAIGDSEYFERKCSDRIIRMCATMKVSTQAVLWDAESIQTHRGFWRMIRMYMRLMGFLADVMATKCEEFNRAKRG